MKNFITAFVLIIYACLPIQAQENPLVTPNDSLTTLLSQLLPKGNPDVSAHMNLEFYTSAAAYFTEGSFDEAAFKINRVRLEILGSFSKEFNWHFRQSFNKYSNPHALDNLSSSIEYAYVNWKPSEKFNLTVGKQFVAMGGYEYYLNSNKVREFSEFNDYVAAYQAGVSAAFNLTPSQELVLQVTNFRSGEDEDMYVYGRPEGIAKAKAPLLSSLNWNGSYADNTVRFRLSCLSTTHKGLDCIPMCLFSSVCPQQPSLDTTLGTASWLLPVTACSFPASASPAIQTNQLYTSVCLPLYLPVYSGFLTACRLLLGILPLACFDCLRT